MRKIIVFLFAFCFCIHAFAQEENEAHQFAGKHFLASYLECDEEALRDLRQLTAVMDRAVAASGATILDRTSYRFEPDAITMVYLLSESHASIHTYPEYGACFIDLFTCGDSCCSRKFDKILREYLKPQNVSARLFLRGHDTEEALLPEPR